MTDPVPDGSSAVSSSQSLTEQVVSNPTIGYLQGQISQLQGAKTAEAEAWTKAHPGGGPGINQFQMAQEQKQEQINKNVAWLSKAKAGTFSLLNYAQGQQYFRDVSNYTGSHNVSTATVQELAQRFATPNAQTAADQAYHLAITKSGGENYQSKGLQQDQFKVTPKTGETTQAATPVVTTPPGVYATQRSLSDVGGKLLIVTEGKPGTAGELFTQLKNAPYAPGQLVFPQSPKAVFENAPKPLPVSIPSVSSNMSGEELSGWMLASNARKEAFWSSPGVENLNAFASWVTGGEGKSVSERSWIGGAGQSAFEGLVGWPIFLGESVAAGADTLGATITGFAGGGPSLQAGIRQSYDEAAVSFAKSVSPLTPSGAGNIVSLVVIGGLSGGLADVYGLGEGVKSTGKIISPIKVEGRAVESFESEGYNPNFPLNPRSTVVTSYTEEAPLLQRLVGNKAVETSITRLPTDYLVKRQWYVDESGQPTGKLAVMVQRPTPPTSEPYLLVSLPGETPSKVALNAPVGEGVPVSFGEAGRGFSVVTPEAPKPYPGVLRLYKEGELLRVSKVAPLESGTSRVEVLGESYQKATGAQQQISQDVVRQALTGKLDIGLTTKEGGFLGYLEARSNVKALSEVAPTRLSVQKVGVSFAEEPVVLAELTEAKGYKPGRLAVDEGGGFNERLVTRQDFLSTPVNQVEEAGTRWLKPPSRPLNDIEVLQSKISARSLPVSLGKLRIDVSGSLSERAPASFASGKWYVDASGEPTKVPPPERVYNYESFKNVAATSPGPGVVIGGGASPLEVGSKLTSPLVFSEEELFVSQRVGRLEGVGRFHLDVPRPDVMVRSPFEVASLPLERGVVAQPKVLSESSSRLVSLRESSVVGLRGVSGVVSLSNVSRLGAVERVSSVQSLSDVQSLTGVQSVQSVQNVQSLTSVQNIQSVSKVQTLQDVEEVGALQSLFTVSKVRGPERVSPLMVPFFAGEESVGKKKKKKEKPRVSKRWRVFPLSSPMDIVFTSGFSRLATSPGREKLREFRRSRALGEESFPTYQERTKKGYGRVQSFLRRGVL